MRQLRNRILFSFVLMFVTVPLLKANVQDSTLIKHSCKIIEHGFFTFYTVSSNNTNYKHVFSYSLDLKKNTFSVSFLESDTIKANEMTKNEIKGFYQSDVWNKKRIGTSVEKYFLVFHPDFLRWDNTRKLDFFVQTCQKERGIG